MLFPESNAPHSGSFRYPQTELDAMNRGNFLKRGHLDTEKLHTLLLK